MADAAAVASLRSASRSAGVVAGAIGISVAGGWLVASNYAPLAFAFGLAVSAGALCLRRVEAGPLLGSALLLTMPAWTVVGFPQANVARLSALLALAGVFVAFATRGVASLRVTLIDVALLAFVAVAVASALWSERPPNFLAAAASSVTPLAFYAAGRVVSRWGVRRVLTAVLVAAALASTTLWYEFVVARAPLFVVPEEYRWNESGELIFRPGGVFGSPPVAATALAMAFLLGLPLLTGRTRLFRIAIGACLMLCALGAALTLTRAPLVGLACGAVLYLALVRPVHILRIGLAAGAAIVIFVGYVLPTAADSRWYQQGVVREGNLSVRQDYWVQALPLLTNTPSHLLVGHGINSLVAGRPELPGKVHPDVATAPILLEVGPHNQYVRTLFELGLVGLVLLLGWLLGTAAIAVHQARRSTGERRALFASLLASLSAFAVVSLAGDTLRQPEPTALVALVSGLVVALALSKQRSPLRRSVAS
ncbi:MAG TPA: O-antigen ligase family protein [Gaiellaceae bacterium]|jgi:O-antigen ligase|nr:O-antigen ligase family protein [Gaiellaceae bacterium]